ncbi:MAG: PAS domain S-box protein [Phycisphaerae bacterium]|nr:PAS domain S-box protein [Phycisphaerae bacterium]
MQALNQVDRRFRVLAESLPQLVWSCDAEGACDYLGPQWVSYTGVPEKPQLGAGWLEQLHPDDREPTMSHWRAAAAAGTNFEFKFRIRRRDGVYRWFKTLAVPVRDERGRIVQWCGSNTDIDDLKRAEEALEERERRFRAIFNSTFEYMALLTLEGLVLEVNRAALECVRARKNEVVGRPFPETPWWAPYPEEQARVREAISRAADGEFVRWEARYHNADIDPAFIDVSLSPIFDARGNVALLLPEGRDISERKRSEEALRRSEARFHELAESMPQLVWMANEKGELTYVNLQMARYADMERLPNGVFNWKPLLHPEDLERTARIWEAAVASGAVYEQEHRVRMADGAYRWHLSRARRVEGKPAQWFGTATDIHDFRTALRARQESDERFRILADNMPQLAWIADELGSSVWYNARWYDYTGTGPEDMKGTGWQKLHHPDHLARVLQGLRRAREAGEVWEDTFPLRGKDGEYRWFLSRAAPIRDAHGHIVRWFGTNTDVTAQREIEEELRLHRNELQRLVQLKTIELEESHKKLRFSERMAAFGTLSAGVGHDLRNILTPMMQWLDQLAGMELSADGRRIVASLAHSADYLKDMAAGLRSLIAEGDDASPGAGQTDLLSWWREVNGLFRAPLARTVQLHAAIAPDLAPVGISRQALTQAVFNLIQNAGDVLRTRKSGNIWVKAVAIQGGVELTVRDDGPGMSEEVCRRCTEPFFTTKSHDLGTGLGLAIVHDLIVRAGGTMVVESSVHHGTTMTLRLPYAPTKERGLHSASLTVSDTRTRSIMQQLLRAMRCDVQPTAEHDSPRGDLWVVDNCVPDDVVASFALNGKARRAIRIGVANGSLPNVIYAPDCRLQTLRQAAKLALESIRVEH